MKNVHFYLSPSRYRGQGLGNCLFKYESPTKNKHPKVYTYISTYRRKLYGLKATTKTTSWFFILTRSQVTHISVSDSDKYKH